MLGRLTCARQRHKELGGSSLGAAPFQRRDGSTPISRRGLVPALRELRRVLEPGGVLRLGLPDLDRAIDAYRSQDRTYFSIPDDEMAPIDGKFVVQMTWYGTNLMMFTFDLARELLGRAG